MIKSSLVSYPGWFFFGGGLGGHVYAVNIPIRIFDTGILFWGYRFRKGHAVFENQPL